LGVGPLLACPPIGFHVLAKLLPRIDLLAGQRGLFRGQIPGPGLPLLHSGEAVVRAVAGFRVVLAAAFLPPALHGALRYRASPHRGRLRQRDRGLTNRWGDCSIEHAHLLRI
jgi:hypothetical protein